MNSRRFVVSCPDDTRPPLDARCKDAIVREVGEAVSWLGLVEPAPRAKS